MKTSTPKRATDAASSDPATVTLSSFERHLEIKPLSQDTFANAHRPWVHGHADYVPGAFTMAQSALAAYQTVPEDFVLHHLQSNFLAPTNRDKDLVYKVQRLSTGKLTAVRSVTVEQDGGKLVLSATLSFTKPPLGNTGPFLTHSVPLSTEMGDGAIRLDDMVLVRKADGPFVSSERLPIVTTGPSSTPSSKTARALFRIDPALSNTHNNRSHILAIIHLSDFYLLDAPLALHGLSYGIPRIGDASRALTRSDTKFLVTLNHTVHFHRHDGFRVDESDGGVYAELTSPWAKDGRVLGQSRIFGRDGELIATCVQEGYILLRNEGARRQSQSKM